MKEMRLKKQLGAEQKTVPLSNSELRNFQKKMLSAIMAVGAGDMPERMLDPDTQAVFRYLNDFLAGVIPVIEESGGEVSKINEQGLMALYPGNGKQALVGAISIAQNLLSGKSFRLDSYRFSIALCFGYIMSGIVGHGKTYTPITLSEHTGLAGYLQKEAPVIGCHILVTESFAREVSDFYTSFHVRYLGRVYLKNTDSYEKLYDVFDGDDMDRRINKMKSKTIFERAVNRFDSSDFHGARAHFIEVLKADRKDLAAKEYLYLCDRYIAEEKTAVTRQKGYLLAWG